MAPQVCLTLPGASLAFIPLMRQPLAAGHLGGVGMGRGNCLDFSR